MIEPGNYTELLFRDGETRYNVDVVLNNAAPLKVKQKAIKNILQLASKEEGGIDARKNTKCFKVGREILEQMSFAITKSYEELKECDDESMTEDRMCQFLSHHASFSSETFRSSDCGPQVKQQYEKDLCTLDRIFSTTAMDIFTESGRIQMANNNTGSNFVAKPK